MQVALKNLGYEDAFATLVTIGCLACAGVFVLIAWDGMHVLSVCLSISPPIHPFIHPSIHPFIH